MICHLPFKKTKTFKDNTKSFNIIWLWNRIFPPNFQQWNQSISAGLGTVAIGILKTMGIWKLIKHLMFSLQIWWPILKEYIKFKKFTQQHKFPTNAYFSFLPFFKKIENTLKKLKKEKKLLNLWYRRANFILLIIQH